MHSTFQKSVIVLKGRHHCILGKLKDATFPPDYVGSCRFLSFHLPFGYKPVAPSDVTFYRIQNLLPISLTLHHAVSSICVLCTSICSYMVLTMFNLSILIEHPVKSLLSMSLLF